LQDASGKFQESTYYQMKGLMDIFHKKGMHIKRKHMLNQLILMLRDREMLPAIAFVFSRKNVELCAQEITIPILEDDSKVPYIVARECETILRKLPNYQEYLKLPEYLSLVALLEKGIAIHHSGMLPILREMVELAISRKYVKLLFATESFAIGLDCPIKTTIFTSLTKFDGHTERPLYPHEYTQMAGRAGRRGIDTIGYVVHCNPLFDLPSLSDYRKVLGGCPQTLVSKMFISYGLILHLVRTGQTRDFHTFLEKSMMFAELQQSIALQQKAVVAKEDIFKKKTESLLVSLTTPHPICLEYMDLEDNISLAVNKKRKDIQRKMKDICDKYSNILRDVEQVRRLRDVEQEWEKEFNHLMYLEGYLLQKTRLVVSVLYQRHFLESMDLNEIDLSLTPLGMIASQLAEVPGTIFAELLRKWNYFEDATPKQIVGILSCVCDIKVADETRMSTPHDVHDGWTKRRIEEMVSTYREYETLESEKDICTGLKYGTEALIFDIVDEMMEWCDLASESECRTFISRISHEKGVSLGEFSKAILKLNAIAKELILVLPPNETNAIQKLKQIESLILKYVATTQSLYI
jgi:hypothetical protein